MAYRENTRYDDDGPGSSAAFAGLPDGTPPHYAFRDLIQRDPRVCNNCFTRAYDAVAFDKWSGIHGWYVVERWYPRPTRTESVHHGRMTRGLTSACTCGEIDGDKFRPLSFRTACEYGENILDTLDEKGIRVNEDVFRAELRERKREPANQGKDDSHIFAPATTAGIRAANPTSRDS